MSPRKKWTHDELFVALNIYHKLTFGQLHARQPVIIALAAKLQRGANSVAMKLSNFASLDPALKLRGGNELENIVITCAPCNNGRSNLTLAEAGLADPRLRAP